MKIGHILIGALIGGGASYLVNQSSATSTSTYSSYYPYAIAGAGGVVAAVSSQYRQAGIGIAVGAILENVLIG